MIFDRIKPKDLDNPSLQDLADACSEEGDWQGEAYFKALIEANLENETLTQQTEN